MPDGRNVEVQFKTNEAGTYITVTFDPETENDLNLQRQGWQAILNSFKYYTESL
jgi:hypothetical protein